MSDRRVSTVVRQAASAEPPKLADVHSGYAKTLRKLQGYEAESARLRELDPKNPDVFAREFGPGDIDRLEGMRQERIRQLDGTSFCAFQDGAIKRTRMELDRLREEASAIVRDRVAPDYALHLEAVAGAVRGVVDAMAAHDRFLGPMAADNCNLAVLTGGCLPHRLVYELTTWLRQHDARERR